MNSPRIRYFEQEDVLHLVITDELETRSVELNPNIIVELNDKNVMIGVEILNASVVSLNFLYSGPVFGGAFSQAIEPNACEKGFLRHYTSSFLRDAVLDSIQAKPLQLIEAGA